MFYELQITNNSISAIEPIRVRSIVGIEYEVKQFFHAFYKATVIMQQ